MIRPASYVLAAAAAASAIWFMALYVGGSPSLLVHERLGLAPLLAGLGAAILHAYRRERLSRSAAVLGALLLLAWVLFLKVPI